MNLLKSSQSALLTGRVLCGPTLPIAMPLIGHHCGLVSLLSVLGPDGFPLLVAVLVPDGAAVLAGLGVRRRRHVT